jgi:hypothetical protein
MQKDECPDNQDNIRHFLADILKQHGEISSEAMRVFGKLVRLTLSYRDRLNAERNETLTVDETRRGLDAYMAALSAGKIPDEYNDKIKGLVILWLKEINGITLLNVDRL